MQFSPPHTFSQFLQSKFSVGNRIFKWPLTVFGVLFVVLIIVSLLMSAIYKPED